MYWVSKRVSTKSPASKHLSRLRPVSGDRGAGCLLFAALALLLAAGPSRAQGLAGEYTIGATKVKVNIHSWGEDCGPKPKSYTTKSKGKKVTVSQSGDHLVFSNGRSTKKCWSANIKLQRLSVTKKGNSWTVVCKSAPSDSHQEHGKYVITATGTKITVKDTSNYNWKLKESVCKATIVIDRVFSKSGAAVETPPEPEPTPPPEKTITPTIEKDYPEAPPPKKCKEVGAPVKLVVFPVSTETSPGRKVCFNAYAVDKNGCRLHVKPEWKLNKQDADRSGRLDGNCFVPGDNAADSEGVFRVVAEYSYYSAGSKVVVKSMSIEDLIAVNLDPTGEEDQAAGDERAGAEQASSGEEQVDVPLAGGRRIPVFLLYVIPPVLLVVLLLIVVFVGVSSRRKKLKRRIAELEAQRMHEEAMAGVSSVPPQASAVPVQSMVPSGPIAPVPGQDMAEPEQPPARQRKQAHIPATPGGGPARAHAAPPAAGMVCRVCGRETGPDSRFCPHDGSELVPAVDTDEVQQETGMICPRCGRGYSPDTRNCGEDGELLVPAPVADAGLDRAAARPPRVKKLICPVCSTVYEDGSTFCGNDGSSLVPMN